MEAEDLNGKPGSSLITGGGQKMRKSRLQRNSYTISLLREGLRAQLLTQQQVLQFQNESMEMLQELIGQYTQGESTSVTTEIAEELMTSLLYATDAWLSGLEEPEEAVGQLTTMTLRQIHEKGLAAIRQCFEETKRLYQDAAVNKLDVPVDAYHLSIDDSIPVFLRKYSMIFGAHHTMASIDYPLAHDDMQVQGVFYIKQYLERFKLETEFCKLFDHQDLLELLVCYGRENRVNYRIELFNIFELVRNNAVFSLLAGGEPNGLRISEVQFNSLEQQFTGLAKRQLKVIISEATERLLERLPLSPAVKKYILQGVDDLSQRLVNGTKHHSLHKVVLTERAVAAKSLSVMFNEENRMSDVQLRRLLDELASCGNAEDKVRLMAARVQSLHDYLDLLESGCFYGEEYGELFRESSDLELAVLVKHVFYEELREDSVELREIVMHKQEYSLEWHYEFARALQGMEPERLQAVGRLADELDYEQMSFY